MTGLDTNVLVRYLTRDNAAQARKAAREIDARADRGETFFIANVVLCELVWVLQGAYGYSRADLAAVIEELLRTQRFDFEDTDLLWRSLRDYRKGKGGFADHLIGHVGRKAGCDSTLTFDRALKGSPSFRVL